MLWKSLWRSPEIIFTQNCLYLLKINTKKAVLGKEKSRGLLGCSVSWMRQVPEDSSESEERPGRRTVSDGKTHTLKGLWVVGPDNTAESFEELGQGDLVLRKER